MGDTTVNQKRDTIREEDLGSGEGGAKCQRSDDGIVGWN
jgi:hypothetical protein